MSLINGRERKKRGVERRRVRRDKFRERERERENEIKRGKSEQDRARE